VLTALWAVIAIPAILGFLDPARAAPLETRLLMLQSSIAFLKAHHPPD